MSDAERERYNAAFAKLCPESGTIGADAAAATLAKSHLPRKTLGQIWKLADVDRYAKPAEATEVSQHLKVGGRTAMLPFRILERLRTSLGLRILQAGLIISVPFVLFRYKATLGVPPPPPPKKKSTVSDYSRTLHKRTCHTRVYNMCKGGVRIIISAFENF